MDLALLRELTEAVGTPGREEPVRAILRRYLEGHVDELRTDALGNLIARKGSGPVRVLLDGHMDEVGLLVSGFTPEGYLQFKKSGGIDDRVLPGRAVWVGPSRLPGVIGLRAPHLSRGEKEPRAVPARELVIDIGARSREEAMALCDYGDPVVWATRLEEFGPYGIKAKALDNRVGCALAAEIIRHAEVKNISLYAVFAVQEEIGLRGARVAARQVSPHVALALECTSCGEGPGVSPPETVTLLGKGPALSWMDGTAIVPEGLRRHLEALAERAGIPYQYRTLTTAGTDAGQIHLARAGVPTAVVSVPCRYIHSGAGLIHRQDYEGALALVRLFVESIEKGEYRP
ncbi:MAG: M42 family metallopeptidase [Firmicutes bacterium]|nr:M42 family metallopeptidase [Bacillota bacterium]